METGFFFCCKKFKIVVLIITDERVRKIINIWISLIGKKLSIRKQFETFIQIKSVFTRMFFANHTVL